MMVVFEIYNRIELGSRAPALVSKQHVCLLVKNHIRQKLPTLKDVPIGLTGGLLTWSLKCHEFSYVNREKLSSSLH